MAGSSEGSYVDKESTQGDTLMDAMSEKEIKATITEFQKISSVDEELAQLLLDSGFVDMNGLADAPVDKIAKLDELNTEKASEIIEEARKLVEDTSNPGKTKTAPVSDNDDELAKWLTGETDGELEGLMETEIKKEKKVVKSEKPSMDENPEDMGALKSWLKGDSDSFSEWLGEETFEEEREELEEEIAERHEELIESRRALDSKMHEMEALKGEFEERLKKLDTGEFDPNEIVQENLELREEIGDLKAAIGGLEEEKEDMIQEVEEIKQGSIAMLKYLKSQKMKQTTSGGEIGEGQVAVDGEEISRLKEDNIDLKGKIEAMKASGEYEGVEESEIIEELKGKEAQLERYEREIKEKTDKIQSLQDDLNIKNEELEKIKGQLQYKEDELNKHETDLQHREELIRKQMREVEALKDEFGGTTEKERQRRMEELEKEVSRKEQELKAKVSYMEQKERELRAREDELIDEELEERKEEILQEIEQEKAKTGTSRLDDLLLGGFPLGSNLSIYGPPHVGKRVMINSFIAEGLEKGVPAIWVITDKTIAAVRQEMKFVLPTYQDYEMRGLIYYVDAYSVSMGEVREDEKDKDFIKFIDEQSDVSAITEAVEKFAREIMKKHRYYRLAFESVSTIIAYLDTTTTFRTLQPFAGRRRRDQAVALYTLEKGMHSEQDISMLGHMMDGQLEFKFQQLQTYLRVEGLGDVQTRQWVKYSHSKSGITMGSFSLDTIR